MSRHKFTDRWVASREVSPGGARVEFCDLVVPGLRLRVSAGEVRAFSVVLTQADGSLRRLTIGRHPRVSVAMARAAAIQRWRDSLAPACSCHKAGGPFTAPPQSAVAQEPNAPSPTFANMVDAYVELHCRPNARSWKNIAAALRHQSLRHLFDVPAAAVTKAQLIDVLDRLVAAGTPHAAISVRKYVGMAFRWACDREMVPANPTEKIRQPARTTERERVLTDAELAAVFRAAGELSPPFGQLFKCLILLGQRRTETATMRWSHIVGNEWHVPRSKSGRPLLVPLPAAALAIIGSLPRYGDNGYVFSTTRGESHSSGYSKAKVELDRLSGVGGTRIHDWRRTYRSGLSRLGVPQDIARKMVGHSEGVVDRIYDRFAAMPARHAAAEAWCQHVLSLVE